MEDDKTETPEIELTGTEQVLVLPGYLFFIEAVEVPASLETSEVPDFAELSLESISPFPIDQLNWGYLYREGAATLLLYAAHRDRLKQAGYNDLIKYTWVFPDFATLSGACFTEDTLVALEGENSAGLLYFKSNAKVPQSVWVDTLLGPMTEHTVETLKANIKDLPETAPTLQLLPVTATLGENGLSIFEHAVAGQSEGRRYEGTWQMLTPTESQLWQADVRSTDFKTAEYSKRRTSAWIGRTAGWAAMLALLLIGLEAVLFACGNWLDSLHRQVNDQSAEVGRIENKQALTNKLDQVAQNELRPITILEAANDIRLRLKLGIEYDSAVIEGENYVTIEGKASSINALNQYVESLKNSGLFELLASPENITRGGKTTFKVSLAYRHVEPSNENTPEPPEPIEEAEI